MGRREARGEPLRLHGGEEEGAVHEEGEEEATMGPTTERKHVTMSEYGEGRYGAFPAAGGRHEPEGEPDGRTGQVGRNPPTYPVLTENEINGVCYPEVTFVVWA